MANCVIAYDPCFSCAEKKCEICELDMHRKGVFQQSEGIANNATTTGKWISVEERLPEDGVRVLTACDDGIVRLNISKGGFPYVLNEQHQFSGVTHWMPLPEAPKMKGGAE